jgi:hypothetical protein
MKSDDSVLTQTIARLLFHWKSRRANHKKKKMNSSNVHEHIDTQGDRFVVHSTPCTLLNNFQLHFLGADYGQYTYNMSND